MSSDVLKSKMVLVEVQENGIFRYGDQIVGRTIDTVEYDLLDEFCPTPEEDREAVKRAVKAKREEMIQIYSKEMNAVEQVLGKVLGYPELYPHVSEVDDGQVCVAPELPIDVAEKAAKKIRDLEETITNLAIKHQAELDDTVKQKDIACQAHFSMGHRRDFYRDQCGRLKEEVDDTIKQVGAEQLKVGALEKSVATWKRNANDSAKGVKNLYASRDRYRKALESIRSLRMDHTAPEYFLRALKDIIDEAFALIDSDSAGDEE